VVTASTSIYEYAAGGHCPRAFRSLTRSGDASGFHVAFCNYRGRSARTQTSRVSRRRSSASTPLSSPRAMPVIMPVIVARGGHAAPHRMPAPLRSPSAPFAMRWVREARTRTGRSMLRGLRSRRSNGEIDPEGRTRAEPRNSDDHRPRVRRSPLAPAGAHIPGHTARAILPRTQRECITPACTHSGSHSLRLALTPACTHCSLHLRAARSASAPFIKGARTPSTPCARADARARSRSERALRNEVGRLSRRVSGRTERRPVER